MSFPTALLPRPSLLVPQSRRQLKRFVAVSRRTLFTGSGGGSVAKKQLLLSLGGKAAAKGSVFKSAAAGKAAAKALGGGLLCYGVGSQAFVVYADGGAIRETQEELLSPRSGRARSRSSASAIN